MDQDQNSTAGGEYLKRLRELLDQQHTTGGMQGLQVTWPTYPTHPCPNCGHCPTCGRGRRYTITYEYTNY